MSGVAHRHRDLAGSSAADAAPNPRADVENLGVGVTHGLRSPQTSPAGPGAGRLAAPAHSELHLLHGRVARPAVSGHRAWAAGTEIAFAGRRAEEKRAAGSGGGPPRRFSWAPFAVRPAFAVAGGLSAFRPLRLRRYRPDPVTYARWRVAAGTSSREGAVLRLAAYVFSRADLWPRRKFACRARFGPDSPRHGGRRPLPRRGAEALRGRPNGAGHVRRGIVSLSRGCRAGGVDPILTALFCICARPWERVIPQVNSLRRAGGRWACSP
jgi:hypothetical protein